MKRGRQAGSKRHVQRRERVVAQLHQRRNLLRRLPRSTSIRAVASAQTGRECGNLGKRACRSRAIWRETAGTAWGEGSWIPGVVWAWPDGAGYWAALGNQRDPKWWPADRLPPAAPRVLAQPASTLRQSEKEGGLSRLQRWLPLLGQQPAGQARGNKPAAAHVDRAAGPPAPAGLRPAPPLGASEFTRVCRLGCRG